MQSDSIRSKVERDRDSSCVVYSRKCYRDRLKGTPKEVVLQILDYEIKSIRGSSTNTKGGDPSKGASQGGKSELSETTLVL